MKPHGLDANAPERGALAGCYFVAQTACYLLEFVETRRAAANSNAEGGYGMYATARHACELHRISGQLHRLAERDCCEDLHCRECGGAGFHLLIGQFPGAPEPKPERPSDRTTCRACSGTGSTIGRRRARLRADAEAIATHYGFRCYFQNDPRGCGLWLIAEQQIPQSWAAIPGEPLEAYVYGNESQAPPPLATLQERWIESNYDRGHAVARIGR